MIENTKNDNRSSKYRVWYNNSPHYKLEIDDSNIPKSSNINGNIQENFQTYKEDNKETN